MQVEVVKFLVTQPQLKRIVTLFNRKKHSGLGYFFEAEELKGHLSIEAHRNPDIKTYSDLDDCRKSVLMEKAFLLTVYREIPHK